jgi:hypothetical protein
VTSPTDLAYLAGFFDGEGSLGNRAPHGYFRLDIGNTNRTILELFKRAFGGNIYEKKTHSPLSRKQMYQWALNGDAAWEAYYAMRPYLREKIWKNEPGVKRA